MWLGSGVAAVQAGSCTSNSAPSPGTFICHRCGCKREKKKRFLYVSFILILYQIYVFIHSASFCFWAGEFKPFAFKVITEKEKILSLCSWFYISYSFFVPHFLYLFLLLFSWYFVVKCLKVFSCFLFLWYLCLVLVSGWPHKRVWECSFLCSFLDEFHECNIFIYF